MNRKTTLVAVAAAFLATSASAQDPRVEISGTAGWTFSDGVSGEARTVPGVGTFDRVDPKDAFSWGARIGFNATPNAALRRRPHFGRSIQEYCQAAEKIL